MDHRYRIRQTQSQVADERIADRLDKLDIVYAWLQILKLIQAIFVVTRKPFKLPP